MRSCVVLQDSQPGNVHGGVFAMSEILKYPLYAVCGRFVPRVDPAFLELTPLPSVTFPRLRGSHGTGPLVSPNS